MHSPPASFEKLLAPDEPPPFTEVRAQGGSDFVILVDHASARIPRRLGNLGLPAAELERHIAWDIGALEVALLVSEALDAPLLAQNYSRLVIDCNRDPKVATSIPTAAFARFLLSCFATMRVALACRLSVHSHNGRALSRVLR